MTDIQIKNKVECVDGPCGKLTRLIADPESRKLTHFVVKDNNLPNSPDRLVSVDMVRDTTGGVIRLKCTRNELERMPPYTTIHYVQKSIPDYGDSYISGTQVSSPLPAMPDDTWTEKVKDKHTPEGELDLTNGMVVKTEEGKVGQVDGLVVDPDSSEITHILMRKGHLWKAKDICVPVSAIEAVDEDEIHLKIDKNAIKELPSVPLKSHFG